jgi:probable F420-dependent oxidoreductase
MLKFGIGIPNCREGVFYPMSFAGPKEITELAQLGEQLGFYSLWGTDFINPVPSMNFDETAKPNWYELIVTLSYLAAATNKIKLATGVSLLPYRDPIILAKQVATLDQFSNGRFLFGWGLGQFREEFVAINNRNKTIHRGRLMNEIMESLHLLLNKSGKISFDGEYIGFKEVEIHPKPLQEPIPVYIGGHSSAMGTRVAKWATGVSYSATILNESINKTLMELQPDMDKEGRTIDDLDVVISTYLCLGKDLEDAKAKFSKTYLGQRLLKRINLDTFVTKSLFGTPNQISERINQLNQEGMKHCVLTNVCVDSFSEMKEQIQIFGEEILPQFN